jgi:hypothetical protein
LDIIPNIEEKRFGSVKILSLLGISILARGRKSIAEGHAPRQCPLHHPALPGRCGEQPKRNGVNGSSMVDGLNRGQSVSSLISR